MCSGKYDKDLYYFPFVYLLELPDFMKTMIILDIDLRFRIDVGLLNDKFLLMNRGEIFALGKDFYPDAPWLSWAHLEKHKHSSLNMKGPFQALNSGVVLVNVERLRRRPNLISPEYIGALKAKYKYACSTDQSVYHLLRYEHPNLVYTLPCQFNYLVHVTDPAVGQGNLKYDTCLGKPLIQHLCGEPSDPYLSRYNHVLKLSTWCWNPTWHHCY